MILLWGFRGLYTNNQPLDFSFAGMTKDLGETNFVALVGFVIMAVCMTRIYFNKTGALITKDMFALTRHPMYHGMYLVDLALFFEADLKSIWFWVSWVIFTLLILTAGWYQEKETLARWGEEAQQYYRRTPRFIFEWLWFKKT